MKKMMSIFMIGFLAIVLAACGGNEESDGAKNEDQPATEDTNQQEKKGDPQKQLEAQQIDEKKTVAIVNDQELLGSQYNNTLGALQGQMQQMGQDPTSKEASEQIKDQTIDSLVGQTLLLQEADKKGYEASEADITKQLDEVKAQFKTEKEFKAALEQSGMDMKSLEAQISEDIKLQQYVEKELPAGEVTDEEIQTTYDQYAEQGKAANQEVPKLEEMKPQIEQSLQQQKQQEQLAQQVEKLKEDAKIDIKI